MRNRYCRKNGFYGFWRLSYRFGVGGFTLVETLVVATIFTIISFGIAATFISGIKLWARAENSSKYEFIFDMERFSRDLRQSINIPLIGFEGKADTIIFPVLKDDSILKVTYSYDSERKVFLRKEVGLKYIITDKEKENTVERLLLPVENLSISYLYFSSQEETYKWKDSWEKADGSFLAVKLEAKYKDEDFSKTVFIPISI